MGEHYEGDTVTQTKKREDVELRGSPFLFDTWEKGSVIVADSLNSEQNFKFKLDVSDHEIWIQPDKGEPMILTDLRITGLDIVQGDSVLHFRKMPIISGEKSTLRFVQVLFKGNRYALCKYVNKEFIPANAVDKGVAVVGRKYDSYETATAYYTINDKQQIRKIALKRGDIYKVNGALVEKNRDTINKFCADNSISNPLDEQDAIDLIQFLDGLKD